MTQGERDADIGYFALALLLIGLGLLAVLGLLIFGLPLFLLGLALLGLGPRRFSPRIFWPVLSGLVAFAVAFMVLAEGGCTTTASAQAVDRTTCTNALGVHFASQNRALLLALAGGLVAGGVGALGARALMHLVGTFSDAHR